MSESSVGSVSFIGSILKSEPVSLYGDRELRLSLVNGTVFLL